MRGNDFSSHHLLKSVRWKKSSKKENTPTFKSAFRDEFIRNLYHSKRICNYLQEKSISRNI
jgi:hypothetical protein